MCRLLVPEGSAGTRRNILFKGSGSSDAVIFGRAATMPEQVGYNIAVLSPIDDAHVASSSRSTNVQAVLSAHTSGSGVNRDGQLLE